MSLKITKVNTPADKMNIKCPYVMDPRKIIVHNTANNASAMSEISYMLNNSNQVSYHFAVDNTRAVQGIPLNRNTWNAGDGATGKGNRQGISVEICHSTGNVETFKQAEKNAAKLVAMLLKQYGWDTSAVTKHEDYSATNCPHKTLSLGWERFMELVKAEYKPNIDEVEVEPYSGYVSIIYSGSDGIDVHTTPTFSGDVACVVRYGEVFTVIGRVKVKGVYMYKLKSGLYITSAKEYVRYHKTLPSAVENTSSVERGDVVQYSGPVYATSTGTGRGANVNGKFRVTIKNNNAFGVHLDNLGWVKASDCSLNW